MASFGEGERRSHLHLLSYPTEELLVMQVEEVFDFAEERREEEAEMKEEVEMGEETK